MGTFLGSRQLIRRRWESGSRGTDGRWTRGALQETPFSGSLQNLPNKRRDVMMEGTRQSDYRYVITGRDFLRTEDDKADPKVQADEVVDCATGEVYKVITAKNDSGLLPHQRCDLLRVREGPT